jgi:hypothetical protein
MTGEVVYLFAHDVANEIVRDKVGRILGQSPAPLDVRGDHTAPRDLPLHQPLAVEAKCDLAIGGRPVRVQVRVYDFGVVSLVFRAPVETDALEALMRFHNATLDDGRRLETAALDFSEQVVQDLAAAVPNPSPHPDVEAYTVFVLTEIDGTQDVDEWSQKQRTQIAGILSDVDGGRLAEAQVTEVLRYRQSLEKSDLVVIDWDAALVVDLTGYVDDVLFVIELANIQLEEFRVMDAALDRQLATVYNLLERRPRLSIGRPTKALRRLRELRVDLTKLADEVMHITKFLGDWYLARVYLSARDRFHLDEWRASVGQRLTHLDELYSVVRTEVNERRMLWLEIVIVVFFAIDLFAILVLRR